MPLIDREGTFRADPIEKALRPPKDGSQTVTIAVRFKILEYLDPSGWQDWSQYNFEASADFHVIKKDGTLNETTCTMLRDVLGFDGNIDSQALAAWSPPACQVTVRSDTYQNKTRYRIEWINPWDHEGGMRAADENQARQMASQHQSKLRAFFGQKTTTTPAPRTRPAPPPPSATSATAVADEPAPSTKEKAWAECCDAWNDDQKRALVWSESCRKIAGDKPEGEYTPQDWGRIAEIVAIPF